MGIASTRRAGFLRLLFSFSASSQQGCRCQRARQAGRSEPGAQPAATAWLGGDVVDRRDHPVPAARVLAVPLPGDGGAAAVATSFETASDLGGHFRLGAIPPGPYRLLIEAAGFPPT